MVVTGWKNVTLRYLLVASYSCGMSVYPVICAGFAMIKSVPLLFDLVDQCRFGEREVDVRGPRLTISAHKEETNASEGRSAAHNLMRLYD